ncbi:MAG TPA: hypothetical protein VGK46_10185 [Saprospiraceae bacterium]
MKLLYVLTGVLISCIAFSCEDDFARIDCAELRAALIALDVEDASVHINALLEDLQPVPVSGDPYGHEINLELFVDRLQSNCSLQVELECYACIETYPPQSHVTISLDSSGTEVTRTLDILTPKESEMTLHNIHR